MKRDAKTPPSAASPTDWLNYHHLRYFWTVAREGSLARAAARLHISQPSISEQIHELEDALGEQLFQRQGRSNRLTDAGQIVLGYAEEIFTLGRELVNSVKQRPGAKTLRLHVGVTDSFPKLVTYDILKPALSLPQPVHVICREGKQEDLLGQLAAHRLDIVLSDEPASSSTGFKSFTHELGESGSTFCAHKPLAKRLKGDFPGSLNGAPTLLPAENSALRRALELWFREQNIAPQVLAECEDLALMKVMAAEGRGVVAVPTIALEEAIKRYGFHVIGEAKSCKVVFHAITVERRIRHPAATAITARARPIVA